MYLYGPLILVLEVLFVMHAIRRGHDSGWIYLIIFVPVVGCAVYFIMVIIPEMQGGSAATALTRRLNPTKDLNRHMENLQDTDSVANKARFADELLSHGKFEEAVVYYREALTGAFRDDPDLTFGLSKALFNASRNKEAVETLEHLNSLTQDGLNASQRLLYAMALESVGSTDRAREQYETVIPGYVGPEAKCRYAMFLLKSGEEKKAREIFCNVVATAERSPRFYRKLHRQWIDAAKRYA